jgi:hypothetical protein
VIFLRRRILIKLKRRIFEIYTRRKRKNSDNSGDLSCRVLKPDENMDLKETEAYYANAAFMNLNNHCYLIDSLVSIETFNFTTQYSSYD